MKYLKKLKNKKYPFVKSVQRKKTKKSALTHNNLLINIIKKYKYFIKGNDNVQSYKTILSIVPKGGSTEQLAQNNIISPFLDLPTHVSGESPNHIYNNLKYNQYIRQILNVKGDKLEEKANYMSFQPELIEPASSSNNKEEDNIKIDKRILPIFSAPIILKKISDKKKGITSSTLVAEQGSRNKNKLNYKITNFNKKLKKLVKLIKKYNLTMNSFKGSKLDLILYLRNNLYFNLNIRFSNIFYKINLISPALRSRSKKREGFTLLFDEEAEDNKRSIYNFSLGAASHLQNISSSSSARSAGRFILPTQPSLKNDLIDTYKDIVNNKEMDNYNLFSSLSLKNSKSLTPNVYTPINEKKINYLLLKLNNLMKKIEYIINIININEIFLKNYNSINNENNIDQLTVSSTEAKGMDKKKLNSSLLTSHSIWGGEKVEQKVSYAMPVTSATKSNKNLNISNICFSEVEENTNKKDIYLKITSPYIADQSTLNTNNIAAPFVAAQEQEIINENKIKIEETIKSITKSCAVDSQSILEASSISLSASPAKEEILSKEGVAEVSSLQDKGIFTKKFDSKFDTISLKSNPVDLLYFNNNINQPIINKYLKSMSSYNMVRNGTIMYFSNIISYNFYNNNLRPEAQNIYKLLYSSFRAMNCLISKPIFIIKSNKITIQLFYYLLGPKQLKGKIYNFKKWSATLNNALKNYVWLKKKSDYHFTLKKRIRKKFRKIYITNKIGLTNSYPLKLKKLIEVLNNLFKKPVELELIRLHYPYNDSNILARLLGFMINKIKFRRITRKLIRKSIVKNIKKQDNKASSASESNVIPAFLTGLNIKVAGRLLTYKAVPRRTVKMINKGCSSIGKINYTDLSRYTNKNKRGAFTILVKSSQNFF
nr:ribosomal protein S3 [Paramarasmius palmivorus]